MAKSHGKKLEATKEEKKTNLTLTQEYHEGPLPHPGTLKAYNDILPGAAERILVMAEREQIQAHKVQNEVIWIQNIRSIALPALSFVITMSLIIGGMLLILFGGTSGDVIGFVSIFVPSIFVYTKSFERDSKKDESRSDNNLNGN